jgi:hypothetical protein
MECLLNLRVGFAEPMSALPFTFQPLRAALAGARNSEEVIRRR